MVHWTFVKIGHSKLFFDLSKNMNNQNPIHKWQLSLRRKSRCLFSVRVKELACWLAIVSWALGSYLALKFCNNPPKMVVNSALHCTGRNLEMIIEYEFKNFYSISASVFVLGFWKIKSENLQYNTPAHWVNGTNDSLTNHLMFQALFFSIISYRLF